MNKLYFVYDKVSEDVIMCGLAPTGGAFIRSNARLAQSFNPNFETDFVVIETLTVNVYDTPGKEFSFSDLDNYVLIPWSAYKTPDHPNTPQPALPKVPVSVPVGDSSPIVKSN